MADDFPSILSRLRREKHVNQRTAAAALNISQALLSHYENGLREPGFDFVNSACTYYGVSADYLLGRTPMKAPFASNSETTDNFLNDFSETLISTFSELFKGLANCEISEAKETVKNILTVFLYSLMRTYDKNSKFEISEPLSPILCDAAIKIWLAKLQNSEEENKLSFTLPQGLKNAAEKELTLIINEWK